MRTLGAVLGLALWVDLLLDADTVDLPLPAGFEVELAHELLGELLLVALLVLGSMPLWCSIVAGNILSVVTRHFSFSYLHCKSLRHKIMSLALRKLPFGRLVHLQALQ